MTKIERAALRMKRMDAIAYGRARRENPDGHIGTTYHTEMLRLRKAYPL